MHYSFDTTHNHFYQRAITCAYDMTAKPHQRMATANFFLSHKRAQSHTHTHTHIHVMIPCSIIHASIGGSKRTKKKIVLFFKNNSSQNISVVFRASPNHCKHRRTETTFHLIEILKIFVHFIQFLIWKLNGFRQSKSVHCGLRQLVSSRIDQH